LLVAVNEALYKCLV